MVNTTLIFHFIIRWDLLLFNNVIIHNNVEGYVVN